ncbi:hypothetical protein ABIB25_005748 [Nakamurella sp. UYEF19]|uniref:ricin-type beta-trefoil lectin domain protein n=1 Tax=Nakamurella sp. UYEF19 TaxID=1756392 RepID=UPI00339B80FA
MVSLHARRTRKFQRLVLPVLLVAAALAVWTPAASADNGQIGYDNLRTAWDPNEAALSPANVSATDFGQLFSTVVDGQVYAAPLVVGNTLVAATENNKVYGMNKVTGAISWTRDLGPAWPASAIGCGDLVPNIGVTSTPVYDPSTQTIYLTSKVNDGADVNNPHWYMHALNAATGAERAGWPVTIQGTPTNSPGKPFNPKTAMQRPGLLLLNGVVYAGFASHCDYGPYVGYVIGVKTSTASVSTLWSTVAGSATGESGIWQSGGGLISDGAGRILFATGNGSSPAPGPGAGGTKLGESVVRLQVGTDGSLTAADYFSPANNTGLNTNDTDFGSGAPLAIPDGFGTAAHPHLLVQIGKDGRLFLLDRDNLGGTAQGPGGTDAVVSQSGPFHGVWGHPAFWGGSGGYVYTVENGSYLRAFTITQNASGVPVLVSAGNSPDNFGYTSGSPVVSSSGTTPGSALVWVEWSQGPSGGNAQLRAYDAVPQNGVMKLRYSAPIGVASKFASPTTDSGRAYVGTRDGHVIGFGRPATSPLTGAPVNFGSVAVGTTAKATLTLTATKALTVNGVSTAAPFGATLTGGAQTLAAGATIAIPVIFTPTTTGGTSGTVTVTTTAGDVGFDLAGVGTQNGLSANPAAVGFGTIATGSRKLLSVNIENTGTSAATITGTTLSAAPFTVTLPANGTVIQPGASVAASVSYAPTVARADSSSFTVTGSTGAVTVALTGSAVSGSSNLDLAPNPLVYGPVLIGTSSTKTFILSNTGNINLTVTKAAPPTAPYETPNPLPEGQGIEGGADVSQDVTFRPTAAGQAIGQYLFGSDDGQGPKAEAVQGVGAVAGNFVSSAASRCMDVRGGTATSGTPVQIYDCNATGGQIWTYGADGSVRALKLCLDAVNNGGTVGTLVQLYACNGTAAQSWSVTTTTIRNTASGLCVAPVGLATTNSVRLQLSTCNASAAQTWTSPQRTGTVVGSASGKCLDVKGGVTANGTAVQLFDCNGTGAQSWTIARGGAVTAYGKCLDVKSAGTAAGTPVDLYVCNGTAAQQWKLQAGGVLVNPASGRCLAPAALGKVNGTLAQISNCTADASQKWLLN